MVVQYAPFRLIQPLCHSIQAIVVTTAFTLIVALVFGGLVLRFFVLVVVAHEAIEDIASVMYRFASHALEINTTK